MGRAKYYKPDRKSLRGFLLSNQLNRPVRAISREIMARAKAKTPRQSAASREKRGDTSTPIADSYRMDIGVAAGPGRTGYRWSGGRRRTADIVNDAPGSAWLELGNRRMRGRHMLRDAGAPYHTPLPPSGGLE